MVKPRYFELRMALIFGTLFISVGIHAPYFPLWLETSGFDAEQIAVILSAPLFVRVVATPFITAMADKAKDRATVYVAMVAGSLVLSAGYFLEPDYALVLGVSLALAVVWGPHGPLADSLALSGVRRFGTDYPKLRIWGSIAFLAANLGGGLILSVTGAGAVPVLLSTGLALALLVALFAPRLGRPRRSSPLSAAELQAAAPSMLTPYFLLFVAGVGAISSSHGFMFAFMSIYWNSLGLNETLVGLLWAWAVFAEVLMFLSFRRLFGSVAPSFVIGLAGLAAIVRWTAMPLVWPVGLGVAGFFATQSLHALSTALVLIGLQKMIAETVAEERIGAAQGIAFFSNGFFMAAVTLFSGPLYQRFGAGGFYVMALVALLGLALVACAWHLAPQQRVRR
jgi:MFS transporter, PPP family, 3-phenylpropionic acid transporter